MRGDLRTRPRDPNARRLHAVEGCGHVDRYAAPECGEGIWPAEIAFGGYWDCPTY